MRISELQRRIRNPVSIIIYYEYIDVIHRMKGEGRGERLEKRIVKLNGACDRLTNLYV